MKYPGEIRSGQMGDNIFQICNLSFDVSDMSRKPIIGAAPKLQILKDITIDIKRGDVVGIVGGSGSGKSTLGRVMLRLLEPSRGKVYFNDIDITHLTESQLRPLRRKFQMIFQDPMSSLNPRHRVSGIIGGPLKLQGFQNIDALINQALDHVGLSLDFKSRYPHELSGGQRQRVGIARAIALRPDFILADEIVSGLDVSSQAQVLSLLQNLVTELGLTLVFISHDLSVVRRLCDKIIVLQDGEVIEQAKAKKLFEEPKHAYTKELLSAIPLPDLTQIWE
jgi:ABC-type oligopeptide transport system ATPase subunit